MTSSHPLTASSALHGVIAGAILLALSAVAADTAGSKDWNQWRGPNRDAVSTETGLLKAWPTGGPKLEWDMKGLGGGLSSMAIVGGKLFTMGNVEGGQCVIAIDLATQKILWKAKVGPANDGPHSTPSVDGNRVYAFGTASDLVCVDAADGKEIWRKNLIKDFGAKTPGWNFSESPLVDGDKLVCTPGDATLMVALNKSSGEVIWKCTPPNPRETGVVGHASIVVSEGAGVRQYVTLTTRGAVSVAAADGKLLWVYHKIANGTANIPTPVALGDSVFVSTAYGTGAALLKLSKSADGVKADEAYFLPANTFQCHHGGFLRVGDYIFGAHGHSAGNPICIELATGKVMWSEKQVGGGSGCVVYADGNLYYRYENNMVALVQANPKSYVLKGSFKLPAKPGMGGPGWAHPVIHDGKLYIRHSDVLFCYDIKGK